MFTILEIGVRALIVAAGMPVVELATGALLRRSERWRAVDPAVWRELPSRAVETVATIGVGLAAVAGVTVQLVRGEDLLWGTSAFSTAFCTFVAGYHAYHFVRVAQTPSLPRVLLPHHVAIIVPACAALATSALHFYGMLVCVTVASAAVRNVEWLGRCAPGVMGRPSRRVTSALYLVLEGVAPPLAFAHLFLVGRPGRSLPVAVWCLQIGPAALASVIALHLFWRVVQRMVRERSRTVARLDAAP